MNTPTRRGLLGGAAVLAAAPMTAQATSLPHPDADLVAVCAEFDACQRQTDIIHGNGPDCIVDDGEANAASAPLFTRMDVLLDRMEDLRAITPAGIQPGRTP